MNLSQENRETIAVELKKFASELNLSTEQKDKLHQSLTESYGKIQEYKAQHPNVTDQEILHKVGEHRTQLRERLVNFLTPEQLQKWDSGVGRAREFLGHKMAA